MFNIIPTPKSIKCEESNGKPQSISVKRCICAHSDKFLRDADVFSKYAERLYGMSLESAPGGIELYDDASLAQGEHRIEIAETAVNVYASEREGAAYAMSTLLQLICVQDGKITVPRAVISDKPDCAYRSVMLDLAFKFHETEKLYAIIDLCYLYKIRFLHLHFADNKAYTLPSDIFPKLPTKGASYSREEIDALCEYAFEHNVEIIPEIEMPGHAAPLIEAYPELFSNVFEESEEAEKFKEGFHNNIICVGKDGAFDNITKLICEVAEMFPRSRHMHVGGDEANIKAWEFCPDCKRYMKENGIEGVYPLYSHFVKLVTDKVLSLGKTPIVWEGFPKEGAEQISRDVLVIAWESLYHLAPDLVQEGFNIVNASWQPLYLVVNKYWGVDEILAWNVYNWQNWWEKSYAYNNPIQLEPTEQVLGGQISSWWGGSYEKEIELIKQNLAALSERTWNIELLTTVEEFKSKLSTVLPIADKMTE